MTESRDTPETKQPWQRPEHFERSGSGNQQMTERIYRMMSILMELSKGDYVVIDDLAENIGVHRRTIQRDFKVIRDVGFNIHYERGKGYITGDDFITPPIRFQLYETLAVMLVSLIYARNCNICQIDPAPLAQKSPTRPLTSPQTSPPQRLQTNPFSPFTTDD